MCDAALYAFVSCESKASRVLRIAKQRSLAGPETETPTGRAHCGLNYNHSCP